MLAALVISGRPPISTATLVGVSVYAMLRQVRNARSYISCVTLVCFGNDVCLSEGLLAPDALLRKPPAESSRARSSIPASVFRQGRRGSICIGVPRRLTIRSSRPHVVASAMCFTLRLHTSAAPPRGGLTQALGGSNPYAVHRDRLARCPGHFRPAAAFNRYARWHQCLCIASASSQCALMYLMRYACLLR